MVSFPFIMRRHLIRLASAPFTSFSLAKFGWVPFADLCVRRLTTKQNAELRWLGKNSGTILIHLWTKVHEILGQCRGPIVSIPDCLCRVSFRRHSPWSLEVVQKPNKCKSFLAPNFWEGRPRRFYVILLARFTVHRLAKFGWVPFADPRLRSLEMK